MPTDPITLSTPGSWFAVGDYTIGDSWDNGPVPNTTFSQTITANTDSLQSSVVISWNWPDTASSTGAYGWSAVQYGFNLPPIQIQNLQSLNVSFSTAMSGAPNNFDLSFDIVVTAQPGASSQAVCEIMYDLHRPASWGQPGIPYSVGTVTGTEDIFVENVPADNLNNIPDVIVYPSQDTLTGAINLTDIIDPLVADGLISPDDYFNGVQLGAETFQGSGSATINNFSVAEVVGQASFTLPAEQAVVSFQAGDITIPVTISDSAANIVANLSGLESLAAQDLLSSITLADAGTPTITVSEAQLAQDDNVFNAIAGPYTLVSTDTGAQTVSGGHLVMIMVILSAPATVSGTPTLQLNDNEVAFYTGGSGSNALSFAYLPEPSDNVSDLQVTGLNLPNGASISGVSGNVAADLDLTIMGKLAPATVAQEINGLYVTLYGIAATQAGITYWENVLSNFDLSVTTANAVTTPISVADQTYLGEQMTAGSPTVNGTTYFATLYPTSMSDMAFVQALYQNMSNFIGTVSGDDYWYNLLQQAEAANGDDVIGARESIAGQFVHDFLSNDLTVGAAALNVSQADYVLLVNGQQALLNKAAISQYYANETVTSSGSTINFTTVSSPAFTAAQTVEASITDDPATVAVAIAGINNAIVHQNLSLI